MGYRELLNEAVLADSGEMTARALDCGATPFDLVAYRHPTLGTPTAPAWFAAAASGAVGVMGVMLARLSVSCNIADGDGETALHWAAIFAQPEAVKVLLAAGADPNSQSWGGFTPLRMEEMRSARGLGGLPADRQEEVRRLLAEAGGREFA